MPDLPEFLARSFGIGSMIRIQTVPKNTCPRRDEIRVGFKRLGGENSIDDIRKTVLNVVDGVFDWNEEEVG